MPPQEISTGKSFVREMAEFALLTLLVVLPIRFFVAEPFIVSGASMEPTFETGDYLIIDQLSYRFHEPERGDVVVFKYPKEPSKYFIKRVIGLPGETVELAGQEVTIKNASQPGGFLLDQSYISFSSDNFKTVILGENEYFVLGDNRPVSSDSRVWGALPREDIVGRPLVRLLPISEIESFPGLIEKIDEEKTP
ncbi:MAG: signal peptidase I [Patescibacteria group bacterium]